MSPTRRRTAALVAPLLLAGLALSGCGVSDSTVRPGLAAQVDGTDLPLSDIDDATTALCAYYGSGAFPDARPFPRSLQRRDTATSFILRVALEHLVDERDLSLPETYGADLDSVGNEFADEPDSDDLIAAYTANIYVNAAALVVGDSEFEAEGTTAGTTDESVARGTAAATAWLNDHDVDINPVLSLALTDDGLLPTSDDLSVPASDQAQAGVFDFAAAEDDPAASSQLSTKISALAETLPADQVCG